MQRDRNRLILPINRLLGNYLPISRQADIAIRRFEESVHVAIVKRVSRLQLPLGRELLGSIRADSVDLEFAHAKEVPLSHIEPKADHGLCIVHLRSRSDVGKQLSLSPV